MNAARSASSGAVHSDHHREAVLAGLDLGYDAVPRGVTHRDVADALSCAPSTESDHLKGAEEKLVRAAMGGADSRGTRAGPGTDTVTVIR